MMLAAYSVFSLVLVLVSLLWLGRQGALADATGRVAAFVLFAVQLAVFVALLLLLVSYQAAPVYFIALCLVMVFCCIADCSFLQESALRLSESLRRGQYRAAEIRLAAAKRYKEALGAYVSQTDDLCESLLHQIEDAKKRLATGQKDAFQGIEASIGEMDNAAKVRRCANKTIDALLALKALEAEGDSIAFSFSGEVPADLLIDDLELCSVFSNLLDNALKAVRSVEGDSRFVGISCSVKGAYLVLKVANGADDGRSGLSKEVVLRGKPAKRLGGSVVFANRSVPEHGWGLRIVQDICARHDGELSLRSEDSSTVVVTAVLSCVAFGEC